MREHLRSPCFSASLYAFGIEEAETAEHTTMGIYNLQGQQVEVSSVEELPRGFYIVNGRKMVVK